MTLIHPDAASASDSQKYSKMKKYAKIGSTLNWWLPFSVLIILKYLQNISKIPTLPDFRDFPDK